MIEALGPTETTEYWINVGPSPIVAATANEPAKQIVTKTVRPVTVARAERGKRFLYDFMEIYLRMLNAEG